ncbi:MAG TPA: cyclase family protein [Pyrinomonadaceae bacterium]|jgi:kynurenine formamidase|nr:cyclase family protein [Pyrinomonadaceae bacterium]
MKRDYQLIDVSHTVEHGMITYKGLPAPVITDHLSRAESQKLYAPGTEFQIGRIEMVANTGTYLDSPFHRYGDGADLAGLDLYSLANLDGLVVRTADYGERGISVSCLTGFDLTGKAVLFHTGWDRRWRTDGYADGTHPFVTEETAEYLAASGAALVGIDSYNIDDTKTGSRPAHSILLRRGIPIVEHLCGLGELPDQNFKFFAVPVKVKEFGTFPVRAFGIVSKG